MVTCLDALAESLTKHVSHAAEKLRRQGSVAAVVHVFIHTNRFRTDAPQYSGAVSVPLIEPSADTRLLTASALLGLRHDYRRGNEYKKAGIMLMGLQLASVQQITLFSSTDPIITIDPEATLQVMAALDEVNQRFGRGSLRLASEGTKPRGWVMRADNRTPAYTTRWKTCR